MKLLVLVHHRTPVVVLLPEHNALLRRACGTGRLVDANRVWVAGGQKRVHLGLRADALAHGGCGRLLRRPSPHRDVAVTRTQRGDFRGGVGTQRKGESRARLQFHEEVAPKPVHVGEEEFVKEVRDVAGVGIQREQHYA